MRGPPMPAPNPFRPPGAPVAASQFYPQQSQHQAAPPTYSEKHPPGYPSGFPPAYPPAYPPGYPPQPAPVPVHNAPQQSSPPVYSEKKAQAYEDDELIAIRLAIKELDVNTGMPSPVSDTPQNSRPDHNQESDEQLAVRLALEDMGITVDPSSIQENKHRAMQNRIRSPPRVSSPVYDQESDEQLAIRLAFEDMGGNSTSLCKTRESKSQQALRHQHEHQSGPSAPLPGYDIESDEKLAIQLSLESFKEQKAHAPAQAKVPATIRDQSILRHQPSGNLTSGHDRYGSASSTRRVRPFEESTDKVPQLFLVAPALEEPIIDGTYRPFRILAPCQAPSILEGGDEDSIHLTHHEGYTIKNPRDLVHKCRDFLRALDAITAYLFIGAAAVGIAHGFTIDPTDFHRPLNGFSRMAQNRTHLRRVGVQAHELYKKQWVVDNHQIEAMIKLFQSAEFADQGGNMRFNVRPIHFGGPTKWVCEECYQLLTRDRTIPVDHLMTLDEYADLTKQATEVNVVLRCSASVITFTRMLKKYVQVRKAIIRIESGYFQTAERQSGTQFEAIQNQFIELAKALKPQPLTSLEIRGDNECGPVFMGLQRVLKCTDLEILQVTGMPHFLEGRDLIHSTYKLRQLKLDGVHVDTQESAENLSKMLRANTVLKVFGLSRSRLTLDAISVLNSNDRVKKRFGELSQLNISNNDFGAATARSLVAMALKGSCLQRLDLSNSRGIGDAGCREILELLQVKGRRLDTIVTDGTGISNDTAGRMDKFRHHRH
ncbi:hypothetical protein BGX34_010781 [Mortierella sp. NVP85]|nr:hypothetical protein BGX34_010781 [Mortierella sp. NVP85]